MAQNYVQSIANINNITITANTSNQIGYLERA